MTATEIIATHGILSARMSPAALTSLRLSKDAASACHISGLLDDGPPEIEWCGFKVVVDPELRDTVEFRNADGSIAHIMRIGDCSSSA